MTRMLPNIVHMLTSHVSPTCASLGLFGVVLEPPASCLDDTPGVLPGYQHLTCYWIEFEGLVTTLRMSRHPLYRPPSVRMRIRLGALTFL